MSVFTPGLVHTPVTPFTTDLKIDYSRYEQLLEFHLAHSQALVLKLQLAWQGLQFLPNNTELKKQTSSNFGWR